MPACGSELARDAFKGAMHRKSARMVNLNHSFQVNKPAITNSKAPETGALLIYSRFL